MIPRTTGTHHCTCWPLGALISSFPHRGCAVPMHGDDIDDVSRPFLTTSQRLSVSKSRLPSSFVSRRKVFTGVFFVLLLSAFLYLPELGSSSVTDSVHVAHASYPTSRDYHHTATTTVTATITDVYTAPSTTETLLQEIVAEPVVFLLLAWSESSATELALLVKTVLMYTSAPVDLHIICDNEAHAYLESRLSLVTHPRYNVRVHFYLPSWQSLLDRVGREGSIKTDHSAGLPGLMKLFIHEILPSTVKKGIYVDTDALFISDPALLWDVFSRLKPTTSIVMGSHPEQDSPEWFHASRICSCVMLLDLEKLRALRLMDSSIYRQSHGVKALSPPTFQRMYGVPDASSGKYENVRLGDQGYWWAIVDGRPDIFEPLDFDFEVTSCLLDTYLTGLGDDTITEEEEMKRQIHVQGTPQEGEVVLPKLLHFNCLHGTPIYMEWEGWSDPDNYLNVRWGTAVEYHEGYKWIWLNTGKYSRTVLEMTSFRDVRFADELYAIEHGIPY